MQDDETIKIYNQSVNEYAKVAEDIKPGKILLDFISRFEAGDYILDLGCGPGNAAAHMQTAGLKVDPVDASPEMVKHANLEHNINARVGTFEDITSKHEYDGIWASFSLLHAPKSEFSRYLKNLHTSIKPEGFFYIGMKLGTDELRDSIGRMYSYYSEDELRTHIENSGFIILSTTKGESVGLSGEVAPWMTILSKSTI